MVDEFAGLALSCGLQLDPWERWVLQQIVSEDVDGAWAAFEFLLIVSRQNGKGAIIEARELGGLFLLREPLIFHTAHRFDTSQRAYKRLRTLIESNPDLDRKVRTYSDSHGSEGLQLVAEPTLILGPGREDVVQSTAPELAYKTRSQSSGRGFEKVSLLVYDEAMFLNADDVGASLPSMAAALNPQVLYTASAGLRSSSQLAELRHRMLRAWDKDELQYSPELADASLGAAEWSIVPHHEHCRPSCTEHDDVTSRRSIAKANPGIGYRLTYEHSERERNTMSAESYARERLGVGTYPAAKDGWAVIPEDWWTGTTMRDDYRPRSPAFAICTERERGTTAVAIAGSRPDGRWGVELADIRKGTSWVVERACELERRYDPTCWVVDSHSAAGSLIDELTAAGLKVEQPTAVDIGQACGQFYDAFRDDQLRHAEDDDVRKALAGAATRKMGRQWVWDAENTLASVCGLEAYTLALWGHRKYAGDADYDISASVGFGEAEIKRMLAMGVYGPADLQRLSSAGIITAEAAARILAGD
jgi:hypothetical protein